MPLIAGVDEAGRGPLAGPVVAAAVILPENFKAGGIKDSKVLSPKERDYFFAVIKTQAIGIGVGLVDSEEIDRLNILQASLKAMRLAIAKLPVKPEKVFIDGNQTIRNLDLPQVAMIKGDTWQESVMCAGIVAKVSRDRLMKEWHRKFPQYGFNRHKGYGTASHLKALETHGPCPIHRRSFAPVQNVLSKL